MSALRPGGSTRRWRRIRAAVLSRDAWRCQFPGRAPVTAGSWADLTALENLERVGVCGEYADHVDHFGSRNSGGGDTPLNLRAACARHNLSKGDRPADPTHAPHRASTSRWEW